MCLNHPIHLHPVKLIRDKDQRVPVKIKIVKLKPLLAKFNADEPFRTSQGDIVNRRDLAVGVFVILHGVGFTYQVAI